MTDTIKQLLRQSIAQPLDHTVLGALADALAESGHPHAAAIGQLLSQWVTRPDLRGKEYRHGLAFRISGSWLRYPRVSADYAIGHRGFLYADSNKTPIVRHNIQLFDLDRPTPTASSRVIISEIPNPHPDELPTVPSLTRIKRALRRSQPPAADHYAAAYRKAASE